MRAQIAILAVAALAAAGCGEKDEADPEAKAKPATAAGFVDCFSKPGFEAKAPKAREESVLAFQARSSGYQVEPVNVSEADMITPAAFLVFFESPEKAAEAMKELGAKSFGEVPPVVRGPAVIGFGDKEDRAAVEPAINACIE
jgi:hypothetical protein